MNNAEWIKKHGYKFTDLFITDCGDKAYQISACGEPIATYYATNEVTYLEIILKWLDQEHKPILTDAEREYLVAVKNSRRQWRPEHMRQSWERQLPGLVKLPDASWKS